VALLCLLPAGALGTHVHANKQMRDHIQAVREALPLRVRLGQRLSCRPAHGCPIYHAPTPFTALTLPPTLPPTLSAPQWASQILTDRDYLGDLSDHLRVAWSHDLGLSVNSTVGAMSQLAVPIQVDVKLVGFAGDGCVSHAGQGRWTAEERREGGPGAGAGG
jgi:hypothetical protein